MVMEHSVFDVFSFFYHISAQSEFLRIKIKNNNNLRCVGIYVIIFFLFIFFFRFFFENNLTKLKKNIMVLEKCLLLITRHSPPISSSLSSPGYQTFPDSTFQRLNTLE